MNEKPLKIGVICPHENFINTAKKLSRKLEHSIVLEVAQAGREDAVVAGKKMEAEGVEVVVTWRGTSLPLRKNLNIPVLLVPIISLQLFQYLQQFKGTNDRILLPFFENSMVDTMVDTEELKKTFDIDVLALYHKDFNGMEDLILNAKEQGCKVVIGGVLTNEIAHTYGMKTIDVPVSPNALLGTLSDACSVALSRRKEHALSQLNRSIIESRREGILAIDENCLISNHNNAVRTILDDKNHDLFGEDIRRFLPKDKINTMLKYGQKFNNEIEKIETKNYLVDYLPILTNKVVTGGLINIRDISNIEKSEHAVRRSLTKRFVTRYTINDFICDERNLKREIDRIGKYASFDSPVLIIGPTGTGKEIIAQSIHNLSHRKKGPFVSINCASMPKDILQSELFGYDEGAFTGSRRGGKAGLFELAHNGTIFLDEIDSAPIDFQPHLLRVLQEKEVMRVGGDCLIPVNIRLISASSHELDEQIIKGRFRSDLYFRLNTLTFRIPPLRERIEDLPFLVNYLLENKLKKHNLPKIKIPTKCLEKLAQLPWTGNVRELSNFIEKLIILSNGIFSMNLFNELYDEFVRYNLTLFKSESLQTDKTPEEILMEKIRLEESRRIQEALINCYSNKTTAAKQLGISRTTLWRKMKALNLV